MLQLYQTNDQNTTQNNVQNMTQNNIQADQMVQQNIENNNTINQDITININGYGKEDVSKISDVIWKRIINRKYLAIPELVRAVHILLEENRNIFIRSTKEKYGMIYNGESWEMRELKKILEDLINDNADRIWDYVKSEGSDQELCAMIDPYLDKINKDDTFNDYKEKIKLLLINNKTLIKESYEKNYNKKLEV